MRTPGGSLQILFFFLVMTGLLCVRLRARAAARVQDLEYAYIKPNRYYAVFGMESCFQVIVPDYAGLEFEFALLHGPMFSTTGYKTVMASQKRSAISSFSYTPRDKGWYKLVATIHDPYSGSLTIQTGPFHCSNQAAGVELLSARISSIMALMHREGCKSAYEKALFVYDWLIHNADYDESLKVYDPYTLLFSGVGVCQSYALAYQMLLHEAGVECLYVVGYAGGDKHAFNLVNFDGAW
ncbi:MAG TPA: transglutaminase-like domain-containing protein, partial [Clostridia bacterium]|nr:transglutaminase-like domain-containing protein [Clostridia bacterium]